MTQPLISLETYYKTLLPQVTFIVYLSSMKILANNLKGKLKGIQIDKILSRIFVSILLLVVYLNVVLLDIAVLGARDELRLVIAAIFLAVLIVRIVQNWQQASYILRSIFEDKALSKKILNYSGLWVFLTILAISKILTVYWIILGLWMILLLIEIISQYKHKGDIHNESKQ